MLGNTSGMIIGLLDRVDTISQQFVFNGYQQMVSTYTPAIDALIALSVIVYGYAVIQGWVALSLAETAKRLLIIGFVLDLALNWGNFSSYIYDFFTKVPNEISDTLIKSLPGTSYSDAGGVNAALQQGWYDGISFAKALWERGDWHHWFPFIWAGVIFLLSLILVGIALIELIVAKFGLAIFLVLAPLILPTILFKTTKEIIFDGWLKHIVTFSFIPIFITSAMALGLSLMDSSVVAIKNAIQADTLTITEAAPYVIFCVVCIGLLIKSTHMASSLAGGFSMGVAPRFN